MFQIRCNCVQLRGFYFIIIHCVVRVADSKWNVSKIKMGSTEMKTWAWCLNRRRVLTPWSRVLPMQLKCPKLLKKFVAFCGTRRFIIAFTRARHLFLSWARLIQSMPFHPTSRRSILILSSHLRLCLPSDLLPDRRRYINLKKEEEEEEVGTLRVGENTESAVLNFSWEICCDMH